MKTTRTTLRPTPVSPHFLAYVLVGIAVVAAAGLAGLSLRRDPAPQPALGASDRPAPVYDATGAMLAAIGPGSTTASRRPVPVYDATGAMQAALNVPAPERPFVYDATGAMLAAINPSAPEQTGPGVPGIQLTVLAPRATQYKPLPVYDATGAMLEALP